MWGGVHQTLLRGSSIDDGDGPTSRVTCCVVMKSGAAFNRTVGCVRMSGFLTFTFQLSLPFSPCLHVLWYRSLDLDFLESTGQSVDHLLLKLDLESMRVETWRWIPMTGQCRYLCKLVQSSTNRSLRSISKSRTCASLWTWLP